MNTTALAAVRAPENGRGDQTGMRFGRLVVTGLHHTDDGDRHWDCLCDCGKRAIVRTNHLRSGKTRSCGCFHLERIRANKTVHGLDGHPLQATWSAMKARCYNPGSPRYSRYGGRGIRVCDRWRDDLAAFVADMGERPSPEHSLDRIDLDGDYTPENCRWATRLEQARNTSKNRLITFKGVTQPLAAWSEQYGIRSSTLRRRLERGWPVARALTTEVRS